MPDNLSIVVKQYVKVLCIMNVKTSKNRITSTPFFQNCFIEVNITSLIFPKLLHERCMHCLSVRYKNLVLILIK